MLFQHLFTSGMAGDAVSFGKFKVSADDTTPNYGENKLVAGVGVVLDVLNPGANETIQISVIGDYLTSANISNEAYNAATWLGVDDIAPSKDAIRNEIEDIWLSIAASSHDPVTIGTANGLSLTGATQELNLALADSLTTGALSATDWVDFHNAFLNMIDPAGINSLTDLSGILTITDCEVIGTTPTIDVQMAASGVDGYLSGTDWDTFNGKQDALTTYDLKETVSSILTIVNGTDAVIGAGDLTIQVQQAGSGVDGFLLGTDWDIFNGKQNSLSFGNLTAGSNKITIGGTGAGALIGAGATVDVNQANLDHGSIGGLADDDHTQYSLVAGTRAFTGVVSGVTPTIGSHLVTKDYADGLAASVFWNNVAVASTANVDIANDLEAGDTIDGYTLVAGDRVLLKDQTDPTENGLYTAVAAGAASRSTDANSASEIVNKKCIPLNGATWANHLFYCVNGSITEWTTDIEFVELSVNSTHNSLAGLQGGTVAEFYHLTSADYTELHEWLDNVTLSNAGVTTTPNFVSTVATGTSPYACTSTTLNTNLNADLLDGKHYTDLQSEFQAALTTYDLKETTSSVLTITNGTDAVIGAGDLTIQVKQASAGQSGYLSSTDWSTFNNKQDALTMNNLVGSPVGVLTAADCKVNGTTPTITIAQAGVASSGYLSATDWNTFNNKQGVFTTSDTDPLHLSFAANVLTGSIDQASASLDGYISSTDWIRFDAFATAISDTAYGVSWNGDTTHAPSKNAVYDKINDMISDAAYNSAAYPTGWDGDTTHAPSKNAIRDLIVGLGGAESDPLSLHLDQRAGDQTIINGTPIFNVGLRSNNNITIYRDLGAQALTIRDKASSSFNDMSVGVSLSGGYHYFTSKSYTGSPSALSNNPLDFSFRFIIPELITGAPYEYEVFNINRSGTIRMNDYTTDGFVKFSLSNGTLAVDTNTYLTTTLAGTTYVPYTGATGAVNLGTQALSGGIITGTKFISTITGSNQPYACSSTYLNTNLNADMLDGYHASSFVMISVIGNYVPYTGATNAIDLNNKWLETTGRITTGTLVVSGNYYPFSAVTAGQVMYSDAPNSLIWTTGGTAGQILTKTGTGTVAWQNAPGIGTFVPYTGATTNVDLGTWNLKTSGIGRIKSDIFQNSSGTKSLVWNGSQWSLDGNFELNTPGIFTTRYIHISGDVSDYYLPSNDGTIGQVLTTNGDGVVSWQDAGGGSGSYVPYTGATSDVDLGSHNLSANTLELTNTAPGVPAITCSNGATMCPNLNANYLGGWSSDDLFSYLDTAGVFVSAVNQNTDIPATAFSNTSGGGVFLITYLLTSPIGFGVSPNIMNLTFNFIEAGTATSIISASINLFGSVYSARKTYGTFICSANGPVTYKTTVTGVYGGAKYEIELYCKKIN